MKPYALITGASQGFGKAMALEFAQRNMNLVLVALPNSGLSELSIFIKQILIVDVHYLELDLSSIESSYKISSYLENNNLSIKYLVNNAGVLSRGFFTELDDNYILKQIEVNVTTPTLLTKLLLNNLRNNAPSGILNISSMASFFALPKKQVYGGTKAYLTSFSRSLAKELKQDGVSVTIICPGGLNTTTRLCYQNRLMGWITRQSVLNPEDAATIAVDALLKRKTMVVPGFINKCLMILDKLLPEIIKDKLAEREINKLPAST
ncbi:SDR family NAD(P)-dependent oxidoreductase [Aestuariibaculum suncheonense]|uniref:SDR family NAD(P)-dependent oxidoreductase n=1 Tax=Aestuariibaculum suncheonense TaxID=1028745 RepID=A0A8J6UC37_9FLAO|nr:SDR family NAD(P)-dependent oxidoreductase [Aestuariibaculum suncheonense]MBD0836355.1 SDR family NAD(P)-dependent oxidoreductase [Aestuariibaculum suncheonense]